MNNSMIGKIGDVNKDTKFIFQLKIQDIDKIVQF